jgi:CheY-like chemotaxis protein
LNLPSAFVAADPNRLQQIIWNLLTNAVKFTPRDGVVDVSLILLANSRLELTVRDTGLGIAANFLPHIFERFRQADSSSSRRHGGLGIGLSIVKQLVDLHGGTIQARSDGEGHGANFVVTLPLSRHRHTETVDTDDTASFDESAATLRGARVLVVDDDPDARQLISRLLDDYGVNVVSASSARECLHLLQTADPSVLISDIGMPGTDGHELIREVRELVHSQLSRIPAMALTAFARPEDRSRALLAGFQVHLSKPIDPRELILNVAGLLRGVPASNC